MLKVFLWIGLETTYIGPMMGTGRQSVLPVWKEHPRPERPCWKEICPTPGPLWLIQLTGK